GSVSLTVVMSHKLCVAHDDLCTFSQSRLRRDVLAAQLCRKPSEKPRATQATAADYNAVAAGLLHQSVGIGGFEDIAIARHRNSGVREVFFQALDFIPVGFAGVTLRSSACVQSYGGCAFFYRDAS